VRLLLQVDDAFAKGDLDELLKSIELMEAAGLAEAAEARSKLKRVEITLKKVISPLPFYFSHIHE